MDMLKIPQWIKTARKGDDMDDIPNNEDFVPKIATIPMPEPSRPFDGTDLLTDAVTARANALRFLEEVKQEQQRLNVMLTEALLELEGEKRKVKVQEQDIGSLHLTITEQQNTIASLQIELTKKNRFMELVRKVLDQEDIKSAPKPERKPRIKKEKPRAEDEDIEIANQKLQSQ